VRRFSRWNWPADKERTAGVVPAVLAYLYGFETRNSGIGGAEFQQFIRLDGPVSPRIERDPGELGRTRCKELGENPGELCVCGLAVLGLRKASGCQVDHRTHEAPPPYA
jgi:hypothetical protein